MNDQNQKPDPAHSAPPNSVSEDILLPASLENIAAQQNTQSSPMLTNILIFLNIQSVAGVLIWAAILYIDGQSEHPGSAGMVGWLPLGLLISFICFITILGDVWFLAKLTVKKLGINLPHWAAKEISLSGKISNTTSRPPISKPFKILLVIIILGSLYLISYLLTRR